MRDEALDHVLLFGPQAGKTTMALLLPMDWVSIQATSGPVIEKSW